MLSNSLRYGKKQEEMSARQLSTTGEMTEDRGFPEKRKTSFDSQSESSGSCKYSEGKGIAV